MTPMAVNSSRATRGGQLGLTDRTVGKMVAADQWAAITEVLHRHLHAHPGLLDALLIDLANLQPAYEVLA